MRATIDIPVETTGRLAETALEGLAQLATEDYVTAGGLPLLYQSGVRYQRERGTEDWLLPSQTLAGGRGDCEDLAAYRVGELRGTGTDPGARIVIVRTGPRTLHAVVQRSDGTVEDPSRALGMSGPGDGVALPRLVAGAERGHTWLEVARRRERGDIVSGPTLSDILEERIAGAELGFIDSLLRAAGGAVNAVVPGLLQQPQAAQQQAARQPVAFLQSTPAIARPAFEVAQETGMNAEDVLRIALSLARIVAQEKRRRPSR